MGRIPRPGRMVGARGFLIDVSLLEVRRPDWQMPPSVITAVFLDSDSAERELPDLELSAG